MSIEYDNYLNKHRANVYRGFEWIRENIPELLYFTNNLEWQCKYGHDTSKDYPEEYDAYDKYFYGNNKSYEVVQNFNKAWLHHIHHNPHHWQHWILINDEPNEGKIILDMPFNYIIEMICDWWAFSWNTGNLYEIFSWYDKQKEYMQLSDRTRKNVEDILNKIKTKLDEGANDDT